MLPVERSAAVLTGVSTPVVLLTGYPENNLRTGSPKKSFVLEALTAFEDVLVALGVAVLLQRD